MKICFVSDSIYPYNKGGKEKRLYEISRHLSTLGHEVHIYTMHWWDGPKDTVEHGVHLHAISKLHPLYVNDRRSIKEAMLFGLACFKLRRVDFDILDVDQMPFFPVFSAWAVCTLRRRRLYVTWHEALTRAEWVGYMGFGGNLAALLERIAVRLPHTITVSSAYTLERMKSKLNRTKRLRLVPPGIRVNRIRHTKPIKIDYDVLFVGRLVKDKNAALLIRAIAVLAEQKPGIECIIVGSGIERDRLLRLVRKHKLENNVHLVGNLPTTDDIYAYMKAAKVFVLPSKREGFGMVVLEALACGTPVVTLDSDMNASRELVSDGIDGSLVAATPAALAEGIAAWIEKSPARRTIARQVADYDSEAIARKQAEVYAS